MQKNANLSAETRIRALKTPFITDLKSGVLKELTEIVKNSKEKELLMCFRGGLKHEYINIYFKGHSLFKIEQKKESKYDISFNFNHARYTEGWEKAAADLINLGYKLNKDNNLKKPKLDKKNKLKEPGNEIHTEIHTNQEGIFWFTSIEILKSLINDFFDVSKTEDFFKKYYKVDKSPRTKTPLLEKQRQQQIMAINQDFKTDYFIYDMEYDQARNSKSEAKSGRFDMLALRHIKNNDYHLVFIELKSTRSACTGKCDVKKHYSDLKRYTETSRYITVRKDDAKKICEQYCDLFFNTTTKIDIKEIELLFVFTDEAKNFTHLITEKTERIELSIDNLRLNYPQDKKTT